MSNRDRDARYDSPRQAIPFYVEEALKHQVRTSLPGVVVSYNASTARARVQPATDLLMTDGTSKARAIILDVPVLHQVGGGYAVHVPLVANDPVWLMFSMRSLAAFKRTLRQGPPDYDTIMGADDCVAWGGFIPSTFTPRNGASIQTTDGTTYLTLERGAVTIHADHVRIEHQGGVEEWP